MDSRLPLPTLLSQAFVAFILELDNEAERRIPHTTTMLGRTPGALYAPWLVSWAMWATCLRFLDEQGLTVTELERRARTPANLPGLERWGYVTVGPDPGDKRPKPPQSAWLVKLKPGGKMAQEIWSPLPEAIEKRWRWRFGDKVDALKETLEGVAAKLDPGLPTCMPILGYGMRCKDRITELPRSDAQVEEDRSLPALLAKVLLAFTLEFEEETHMSLAICANVLRLVDERGVRSRDLPELSGTSKEAIQMAMGILRKFRLVVEEKEAGKPWKATRLAERGVKAKRLHEEMLGTLEERWLKRFGKKTIAAIRAPLEDLTGTGELKYSQFEEGLQPPEGSWRSFVKTPTTLPHFPMVLHRGGYPDGS